MYDIIIIGAGPAGLTAAIYARQARKSVLILEKESYGGQILKATKVKNYPGFSEISGFEFSTNLYNQAMVLEPDIKFERVIEVKNLDGKKHVITEKNEYLAKAIIIATGAESRKLGLNNEEKLIGKGISYCATCDGMFFKDKDVAVIGGGNTAIDDAMYLSDIVKKLYLIYRRKEFRIESINLDKLKNKDNVEIILDTNVVDINGEDKLNSITLKHNDSGELKELNVDALFIAAGHIPVTSMFDGLIKVDEKGYIISNEDCTTNMDGIFVAGDVRKKDIRQLTTACSDGTISALNACKYINKNH